MFHFKDPADDYDDQDDEISNKGLDNSPETMNIILKSVDSIAVISTNVCVRGKLNKDLV